MDVTLDLADVKTVAAILLLAGTSSAHAQNIVVVGPGYQPGQRSVRKLVNVLPKGWVADTAAARKAGLDAVLLPQGRTLANTNAAVTVAFQRKDAKNPGLADLQSFVRVDVQNMLATQPETEAARWQPAGWIRTVCPS